MKNQPFVRRTVLGALVAATALTVGLAGCSSGEEPSAAQDGSVALGAHSNGAATETVVDVPVVDEIRETLPAEVLEGDTLTVAVNALPTGYPPIAYIGDDNSTLTGSEPDLARLVAAVLGLEPEIKNFTWDNMFVGIDSGATDVAFANITVTEERKEKYDFASYRGDNLAFQVKESNPWEFDGDYRNLDGLTVATTSGTNQERILLDWKAKLEAEGKSLDVVYFPDGNGFTLALASGRIDAQFNANPGIAYQNRLSKDTSNPTRTAGTFSGAGESLDGLIGATVKKDSELAQPIADAINYLIENGQYEQWLEAWGLEDEAVAESLVNAPGLPLSNG